MTDVAGIVKYFEVVHLQHLQPAPHETSHIASYCSGLVSLLIEFSRLNDLPLEKRKTILRWMPPSWRIPTST